ncbi:MAG: transglutaminase-like domain-containing protein [Roseburia sp.]|nr:transglutaminase-like domain-containing protein [Roseburia sp.]
MGRTEIKIEDKAGGKEKIPPVSALFCLLAGIFGLLFFFRSVEGIAYREGAVYFTVFLASGGMWCVYCYRRRFFVPIFFLAVLLLGWIAFRFREMVIIQGEQIFLGMIKEAESRDMEVTFVMVLFGAALSLLFFFLEIYLNHHFFLFFLTLGILFFLPLGGISIGGGTLLCLLLFQWTFWVFHFSGGRGKKTFLSVRERTFLSGKSILGAAAVILACFVLAVPIAERFEKEFYNISYLAEGYVRRSKRKASGEAYTLVTGEKVSGGNHYPAGVGHLELHISEKPVENLYLKGFGGGAYIGNGWEKANDDALFPQMVEKLDWEHEKHLAKALYNSMYYEMNSNMDREEKAAPITLSVRHYNSYYRNTYVPYYGKRVLSRGDYDGFRMEGYTYEFYQQKDVDIVWTKVEEEFQEKRDLYRELQELYMEETRELYTQVPRERLPRLVKLVEDTPLDSLDEITAYILNVLQSNASYTLTPGRAPLNEDIAEYFLFDSGFGYCEHFATTATLMYRLYGIPARYAVGYLVKPSDFQQQEDQTWEARVTDEEAHAWVEIFLEDYGWTPVEVTPDGESSFVTAYPGFDQEAFLQISRQKGWDLEIPEISHEISDSEKKRKSGLLPNFIWDFDYEKYEKWIFAAGCFVVWNIILLPFFLDYRRLRHFRHMESMGCRKVYERFLVMLHSEKYVVGLDGTEEEFANMLLEELFPVEEEELKRILRDEVFQMQKIVSIAAYSSHLPGKEDEEFVKKVYFKIAKVVCGRLKWYRKLWFLFGRGFC